MIQTQATKSESLSANRGDLSFDGNHLSITISSLSGNLTGLFRKSDGACLYRAEAGCGSRICWGGEPVRPLTRGGAGGWTLLVDSPPADSVIVGEHWQLDGWHRTDSGDEDQITIHQCEDDVRLTTTYRLHKRLPVLAIDLEVVNNGTRAVNLHFIDVRQGHWSFTDTRCHWKTDKGNFQTQALDCGGSALFWRENCGDWGVWDIQPEPAKNLNCKLLMGGALKAHGGSMRGGGFHVGLSDFQGYRSADVARKWAKLHQLKPLSGCGWAQAANIYETFIGYRMLVGIEVAPEPVCHSPYRTTHELVADLPRIRNLGYNVLYLMPRQPYPGYTTHSLSDAAEQYGDGAGTTDAFRKLVRTAHALGMRVIVDIVLHGGMDHSSLKNQFAVTEQTGPGSWNTNNDYAHRDYWLKHAPQNHPYWESNPEWFSLLNDTECQMGYTRCFDLRHPGFQEYFVKSLVSLLREDDLDGFRFDAPWWTPFAYRWKEEAGYRASWAVGASIELISLLHLEASQVKPDALFFMESSDPFTCQSAHMQYPYDTQRVVFNAMHRGQMKPREAREALAYLRQIRLPGIQTTYWMVDSHDSVWGGQTFEKWMRPYLGLPQTRAYAVLMALLGDALMTYSGSEEGMEELFTQLLDLRQSLPVLARGLCDEIAVRCSDEDVFPVWRSLGDEWAMPVVNFSNTTVNVMLELPIDQTGGDIQELLHPAAQFSINGNKVAMELEPYGYRLFRGTATAGVRQTM